MRARPIRLEPNCCPESSDGPFVVFPVIAQEHAEFVGHLGIIRLKAQDLAISGFRLRQLALMPQDPTKFVMGPSVIRLEANGLPKGCLRFRVLALSPQRNTEVVMRAGPSGLAPDRFPKCGSGP